VHEPRLRVPVLLFLRWGGCLKGLGVPFCEKTSLCAVLAREFGFVCWSDRIGLDWIELNGTIDNHGSIHTAGLRGGDCGVYVDELVDAGGYAEVC
jgi:hypothetical protein